MLFQPRLATAKPHARTCETSRPMLAPARPTARTCEPILTKHFYFHLEKELVMEASLDTIISLPTFYIQSREQR